jgi:fatty-acid O-methyltransferase
MALVDSLILKLSQKSQKYVYPYLTRRLGTGGIFLNYGYETDPPMALPLDAPDEPYRYCIQLYHRTATQADLGGKQVLEVGCGHGGGASYLMRTLQPTSYTGLDLNSAGIAFCRQRHNLVGLGFVQGDAENLPFPDRSFDAVINIESSLHYPRFDRFLAEAARVLRPEGHFLYADVRAATDISAWEAALAGAPMRIVSRRNINAEVMRAMETNQELLGLMHRHAPLWLRGLVRGYAEDVRDTPPYKALQHGWAFYRVYHLTKAT